MLTLAATAPLWSSVETPHKLQGGIRQVTDVILLSDQH